jgi:predicted amidophosphoribosyltransferase
MDLLQRIMDAAITQLGLNPAPSPSDACVYCGDPMTRRGLLCDFCIAHADATAVDLVNDWRSDDDAEAL